MTARKTYAATIDGWKVFRICIYIAIAAVGYWAYQATHTPEWIAYNKRDSDCETEAHKKAQVCVLEDGRNCGAKREVWYDRCVENTLVIW